MTSFPSIHQLKRLWLSDARKSDALFAQGLPIGYELELQDPAVVHYAQSVLRLKAGRQFLLVDFKEAKLYKALLREIKRDALRVQIDEVVPQMLGTEQSKVTLAAVLIKENRWDWLLQKATELGASAIQPLSSAYCQQQSVLQNKAADKLAARWHSILLSAALQSERLTLPELGPVKALQDWLNEKTVEAIAQRNHIVIAVERSSQKGLPSLFSQASNLLSCGQSLTLVFGPEGGWSDEELHLFASLAKEQPEVFSTVHLGPSVLRSETAALVALGMLLCQ